MSRLFPERTDSHTPVIRKTWLKALLSTVSGGVVLMLLLGIALYCLGVWQSGGTQQWAATLKSLSLQLLVFRLVLYSVLGTFCYQTFVLQTRKGNPAGVQRIKRIALASAVIIVLVELSRFAPSWLSGGSA